MLDGFNPYLEWLGIRETARPLSHYQLLGLSEFEENTLAIAVAADAAIARLKNCNPGERAGRWQQLLDELSLAKLCLVDRTRKLQYDAQLHVRRSESASQPAITTNPEPQAAGAPFVLPKPVVAEPIGAQASLSVQSPPINPDLFPPNHRAAVATVAETPVAIVPVAQAVLAPPSMVAMPTAPPLPVAQPVQVVAPPLATAAPAAPPVAAPVAYPPIAAPPQPPPIVPPILIATPVLAPSLPVIVPTIISPSIATIEIDEQPTGMESPVTEGETLINEPLSPAVALVETPHNVQPSLAPNRVEFTPFDSGNRRTSGAPDFKLVGMLGAVVIIALLALVLSRRDEREMPEVASRTPPHLDSHTATVEPKIPVAPPQNPLPILPRPRIKRINPREEGSKEPPPDTSSVPETKPAPVDEPEMKPEPAPEPTPPPPSQPPPPPEQPLEKKTAFEKAAKNARAAMGARDFDRSKQELQLAKSNVGTKEQDEQLARLEQLHGYAEGFWNAVRESLKGLQATDTIPLGGTEVAIVEVDDHSITIRDAGRNVSCNLENMPARLALGLAARWFDLNVPANKLYMGAFHAVDPKGDLDQARRYWEEATRRGANAEHLMPLLSERTALLAEEQQPVPKKALLTKAKQVVRASMSEEFRLAKSPEAKLTLTRLLLDTAEQTEEAVERYVLYDEALKLAADSGSADDINRAIDGLAAWYQVDAWALRAKAFSDAAESTNNPAVAKALAGSLLVVVDQAVSEQRVAEAGKLCTAAITAARKGKDLELVRQANERKAKLAGE